MKIIYVRLRISPIHFNYHKKFNTILTWVLMKSLSDHAPKRSEKNPCFYRPPYCSFDIDHESLSAG